MNQVLRDLDRKVSSLERRQREQAARDSGDLGDPAAASTRNLLDKQERTLSKRKLTLQPAFKAVPRGRDTARAIQLAAEVPPVGAYRARFGHLDPKVTSPRYGTEETWGGALAKESQRIKEADFRAKVKPCPRMDRTLVYMRAGMYQQLMNEHASTLEGSSRKGAGARRSSVPSSLGRHTPAPPGGQTGRSPLGGAAGKAIAGAGELDLSSFHADRDSIGYRTQAESAFGGRTSPVLVEHGGRRSHFLHAEDELGGQRGGYFENNRRRDPNKRDFAFSTRQINNSPYALVSGKNHLEVIRRGAPAELGFKHISNVSFRRSPGRKPFVKVQGRDVNE